MLKQICTSAAGLVLTFVVLAGYAPAIGQGADNSAEIDAHLIDVRGQLEAGLNEWNIDGLIAARAGFERLVGRGGRDWLVRYYIALADYRIAIYNMAMSGDDEAAAESVDLYLDEAEDQLKLSVEEKPDFTDSHAMIASVLGLKIGRKPIRGMWLGPRIGGVMAEAAKFDPENPRLWLIDGIGAFHRPKMFGGGADNARDALTKAIECYALETVPDPALPSWGLDEAYAWLGRVEMNEGNYELAEQHLRKSLDINPEMGWVTYSLMPALEQLAMKKPQ